MVVHAARPASHTAGMVNTRRGSRRYSRLRLICCGYKDTESAHKASVNCGPLVPAPGPHGRVGTLSSQVLFALLINATQRISRDR